MPLFGYDIEEEDIRLESQQYYQELEDNADVVRNIKNFVEGYEEVSDTLRTNTWLMMNNQEHFDQAHKAYAEMKVK